MCVYIYTHTRTYVCSWHGQFVMSISTQASCVVVAVLLQYLFTSAFCWMLCEGVMLYMMLITVFGNKLNRQWFYFILGWGELWSIQIDHIIEESFLLIHHRPSYSNSCNFCWNNTWRIWNWWTVSILMYLYEISTSCLCVVAGLTQMMEHLLHSLYLLWWWLW